MHATRIRHTVFAVHMQHRCNVHAYMQRAHMHVLHRTRRIPAASMPKWGPACNIHAAYRRWLCAWGSQLHGQVGCHITHGSLRPLRRMCARVYACARARARACARPRSSERLRAHWRTYHTSLCLRCESRLHRSSLRACVHACVRARARECAHACVRMFARACVHAQESTLKLRRLTRYHCSFAFEKSLNQASARLSGCTPVRSHRSACMHPK